MKLCNVERVNIYFFSNRLLSLFDYTEKNIQKKKKSTMDTSSAVKSKFLTNLEKQEHLIKLAILLTAAVLCKFAFFF